MNDSWAHWLVMFLQLYVVIGAFFAGVFVVWGVQRLDPAAQGAPWGFRLLIAPGAVALWPWLALRWLRGEPAVEPPGAQS